MTPRYVGRHRRGIAPGTPAQRLAVLSEPPRVIYLTGPIARPALRLFFAPIVAMRLFGGAS